MEIEEDILSSLITCKICKKVLEEPVSLPCAKIICSKHIIEKKDKISIYKCFFCKKDHLIDMNELPINDEILKLISKRDIYVNINTVDWGENNRLAKDSCELLEAALREAKVLSNDPSCYVHEYFSNLKNKIDQTKEEYMELIRSNYELVMKQVLELEKECKAKSGKKESKLVELIHEIENKLNKRNESLRILNFNNDAEWKSFRFESVEEIKRIEDEMDKLKDDLLINKDYDFVPKKIDAKNNFGDFYARNFDTGKIELEMNNFSNIKESFVFIESKETIIKDTPWLIKSTLKKKDETLFLAYYISNRYELEKLKKNPIRSKLTFSIHQNETRKINICKKRSVSYVYENFSGNGFADFISREDLINPLNGFYNKENDSIILEATVKILG